MIFILIINYISYRQADKFLTANNWVIHTYKIMQATDDMLQDILDIESVTHEYIISGNEKNLDSYNSKTSKIMSDIATVQNLTTNNPVPQQILNKLKPHLLQQIKLFDESIKERKSVKSQTKFGEKLINYDQSLMEEIKQLINNLNETEIAILQQHEDETLRSFDTTIYITSIATIVNIFFLVSIMFLFNRLLISYKESNLKIESAFTELENQANTMSIINEMNNILGSSSSIKETLQIISLYIKRLLPFTAGTVYLMKASANYLESTAEWNSPKLREKIFSPTQCWSLRQGRIHTYYHDEAGIICEHNENTADLPSYVCVPMLAQNEIIGVLYLEILQASGKVQQAIQKLVEQNQLMIQNLAGQIALSISNIKLHEILKTRSTRDPLTNLYNRAYLNETLERDIQRAKRKNISIAIVMMDLDHFKNANDAYGHEAGDSILKQIAKLLTENIRESDIICRYGGEEFLIVFYDTTLESTVARIEHIRKIISELQFNFSGILYSPTASFGIAMYPEHGDENPDKLIKASDEAMYQSKHNGRNKATVYKKAD